MCEYEKSLILYISDEGKRTYTLFQGHSGPVYSAAFSPFGDFLLSSSSDLTSNTSHILDSV
jgi:WD40 repeat protein